MKVLVGIKRALDYAARVRVRPDGSGVDLGGARMSVNPFCEIALEEAIRLKEAGTATEVVAVSVGPPQCQDQLRTALALGADRAIHVPLGTSDADPAPTPGAVAAILAALIQREEGPHPGLVLFGKQAIDDDASAVGPLVAAALGWPQATFASRVVVGGDGRGVTVTREVDGGLQTVWAPLPAVVTADLRLNTPRFPSLPAIMKAKKRAIESVGVGELGPGVAAAVSGAPQVVTVRVDPPPPRPPGVMVGSAGELVAALVKAGRLPVG